MEAQEFKIKVLPLKDKLYRLAKMMLHQKEEAEDALQEALLKLWTIKEGLQAYNSLEAVSMRIIKNVCLNRIKSQKIRQMVDVTSLEKKAEEENPYKLMEQQESVDIMYTIFNELPEQQKLIMHLRNVEGYSFEEIEQVTGLSINHIRVILSRARQQVKDSYLKMNRYESK